jgi:hypothetical protein
LYLTVFGPRRLKVTKLLRCQVERPNDTPAYVMIEERFGLRPLGWRHFTEN